MELKYIDCPTGELEIKDLMGMLLHNGYLIFQQKFLSLWDVQEPKDIRKIAEFPFPHYRKGMKLFGDELYVWGKWFREDQSHIHILDVSDPKRIVQKKEIALQDEDIKLTSLYYSEGRIFATKRKSGIIDIAADGTARLLFDEENELRDLVVYKSMLISNSGCGSFDGIRIFNLGTGLEELKYISSQFVLPENIVWLEEGKSVLLIGGKDESVIKINVSDPAKAKRTKSAKTGRGLCEHFVREGNRIYVLGTAIESRQHTPAVL
jgi:hypothetical protein